MCGSSNDQKDINASQIAFYNTLTQGYSQVFGQSQAITGALTSAFTPILQAGPMQPGFTPAQTQSLNTSAAENIATNYAQAQRATAGILAAKGGGNTLLPSSTSANLIAQNANQAAALRSQAQNQITQASYTQGRQNWQQAAGVLTNTAGLLNPTNYAGQATGAGSSAASEANSIAAQNTSLWGAAIGSLGGIAGDVIGQYGLPKFGGSSPASIGYTGPGYADAAYGGNWMSNLNPTAPNMGPINLSGR